MCLHISVCVLEEFSAFTKQATWKNKKPQLFEWTLDLVNIRIICSGNNVVYEIQLQFLGNCGQLCWVTTFVVKSIKYRVPVVLSLFFPLLSLPRKGYSRGRIRRTVSPVLEKFSKWIIFQERDVGLLRGRFEICLLFFLRSLSI